MWELEPFNQVRVHLNAPLLENPPDYSTCVQDFIICCPSRTVISPGHLSLVMQVGRVPTAHDAGGHTQSCCLLAQRPSHPPPPTSRLVRNRTAAKVEACGSFNSGHCCFHLPPLPPIPSRRELAAWWKEGAGYRQVEDALGRGGHSGKYTRCSW